MSREFFTQFDAANDIIMSLVPNRQELKSKSEIKPRWEEYWELYRSVESPHYDNLSLEAQTSLHEKLIEAEQALRIKAYSLRSMNYEDLIFKKEGFFHKVNYKRKTWFEFKQILREI